MLPKRDRRFRELSEEERERLRIASEAEAAARAQAKEDAAKAAKKASKKGGAKAKKSAKGTSVAAPPATPEEKGEPEVDPPSALELYNDVKEKVEHRRALRQKEIARQRAEERLAPKDPTGEAVMEEVCGNVEL